LNNEEECNYEQEILSAWNRLPDTFNDIKNLAMALLTKSPALNNIKTNKRNQLTNEVSGACLA
jgi:hypothetical protein